jgi:Protein of unknown function (DUF2845)
MSRPLTLIALITLGSFSAASSFAANDLRCDNQLVSVGNSRDLVRNRCGTPIDISTSTEYRTQSITRYGRVSLTDEITIEVKVETWIYNFGPHRFMQRLQFRDGTLASIVSLDYGY